MRGSASGLLPSAAWPGRQALSAPAIARLRLVASLASSGSSLKQGGQRHLPPWRLPCPHTLVQLHQGLPRLTHGFPHRLKRGTPRDGPPAPAVSVHSDASERRTPKPTPKPTPKGRVGHGCGTTNCTAVESTVRTSVDLPTTVHLSKTNKKISGFDLSKLERRSVRRPHSGLSGTGRGSSW